MLSAVGAWAVPVWEPAVSGAAVEVWVREGVGLSSAGIGVGERVKVAGAVAVAVPDADSSVGVGDRTKVVGEGVSEGTPGGSVGACAGGGFVGLTAVPVLVEPVGVMVGMVWFR